MPNVQKHLRLFSLLMTLLMLLQSCVVYHKTPVSLDQAVLAKTRSKLFTADGTFAKYKYITEIKGEFYGIKKKSGMLVEIPLGDDPDIEVFLKNKSTSKWLNYGLIAYSVLAASSILWLATFNGDIY